MEIATEIIKGRIYYDTDDCKIVRITDEKGKNSRLTELFEGFIDKHGNHAQVNYWVTSEPFSKEQLIENQLKYLYGDLLPDSERVFMGSWTYGCQSSYDECETRDSLTIGGHDLHDELSDCDGDYLYMEINFKERPCL